MVSPTAANGSRCSLVRGFDVTEAADDVARPPGPFTMGKRVRTGVLGGVSIPTIRGISERQQSRWQPETRFGPFTIIVSFFYLNAHGPEKQHFVELEHIHNQ